MKISELWRLGIFCAFLFSSPLWTGCGDSGNDNSDADKIVVSAGLPPVAYLAGRVGGEAVKVVSMLPEGRSPHDFSPGPREVRDAALSRIFFTTGMRFENALTRPLDKNKVRITDVTRGIERIPLAEHDHGSEAETEVEHDHDETLDPHVWLDACNARRMAENICADLSAIDPGRAGKYRENCRLLADELQRREITLKKTFQPYRGRCFYVYHPAFGYFARMLGLRQEAIELGGREVTPARLARIIREARKDNVKLIFVQPQFSPSGSRALARELGAEVAPADPLREDLLANFDYLSGALERGFSGKREAAR